MSILTLTHSSHIHSSNTQSSHTQSSAHILAPTQIALNQVRDLDYYIISGGHLDYYVISGRHLDYYVISGGHHDYCVMSGGHLYYYVNSGRHLDYYVIKSSIHKFHISTFTPGDSLIMPATSSGSPAVIRPAWKVMREGGEGVYRLPDQKVTSNNM